MWCLPFGFVGVKGSEKKQWPLPEHLFWEKEFVNSCLDARHFSSFPCASGAFLILMMELRGSESELVYAGAM